MSEKGRYTSGQFEGMRIRCEERCGVGTGEGVKRREKREAQGWKRLMAGSQDPGSMTR
jgi:hypothetical protein